MKRVFAALAMIMIMVAALAGCSSGMKDGTYKAEYKEFDEHGWKDYVSITVESGKITAVDYDAVNADGAKKSEDTAYREQMEPISKTYPEKFYKELEDQLKNEQDLKKVEAVAGATTSSNDFKILATEALNNAKAGKTETAVVTK